MSTAEHPWETLKEKPYCETTRRMDFILLFDVKNGNPNGDPDAGNLPRVDPTTRHGIVTDVCIKRKVRDYLSGVLRRPIYIQSEEALNTLYFRSARQIAEYAGRQEASASKEEHKRREEERKAVEPLYVSIDEGSDANLRKLVKEPEEGSFRQWLLSINVEGFEFDPDGGVLSYLGEAKTKRDFQNLLKQEEVDLGGFESQIDELADVLANAKKGKKGSAKERGARDVVKRRMCELYDDIRLFGAVLTAGTNAGQVRGPLQLTFGSSLEEILPQDSAITRCAITKASDWGRKQTEFGRKAWLSYAAYRQHGFYNPLLGAQTGVTSEDLARFWESVAYMFQNSASASRGEMATRDLVVFVHPNQWGKAPSHKLFGLTKDSQGTEVGPSLRVENEDEQRVKALGIEICRPLKDIWADL